ncbi:MAG TPA: M28 family metallopeptidase [Parvularculaceae bacterium]|nr:M28 family metallopeptidase [Parvularculaceae bacterium]
MQVKYLKLGVVFGAAILAGYAAAASPPPMPLKPDAEAALAAAGAAPSVADRIRDDLAYIADDARRGRDTGSEGFLDAARYVAARYKAEGLAPGAGGDWLQNVPFLVARRDVDGSGFELAFPNGEKQALVKLDDFMVGRSFASPTFSVAAPLVFVGYGVVDQITGRDDYAGVDARGKIAVVLDGAPPLGDTEREAYFSSGATKEQIAAAHGAVGLVTIVTKSSEERRSWRMRQSRAAMPAMTWIGPSGEPYAAAPGILATAMLSDSGAEKLFRATAHHFDELRAAEAAGSPIAVFDLPEKAMIKGASSFEKISSANVVAMIKGSDPKLQDEAVVFSAHLDHLGERAQEDGGDGIYNGALDNGIGVTIMLAVAHEFKEGPPPRRTIYFVAQTAEEKGLLGSDYFAHFPTVGGRRIVANVDIDMPLVLYHFTDVVAFGAEHSSLGDVVENAAKSMGIALIQDPMPEESIFTRSDHYSFVKQGVPAVFLFPGFGNGGEKIFRDFMRTTYHKPSDDLSQPIKYDEAARFAELNYRVARRIADDDKAPTWNKGDFFGDLFSKPSNESRKRASLSH